MLHQWKASTLMAEDSLRFFIEKVSRIRTSTEGEPHPLYLPLTSAFFQEFQTYSPADVQNPVTSTHYPKTDFRKFLQEFLPFVTELSCAIFLTTNCPSRDFSLCQIVHSELSMLNCPLPNCSRNDDWVQNIKQTIRWAVKMKYWAHCFQKMRRLKHESLLEMLVGARSEEI